jgi:hypothetical protein
MRDNQHVLAFNNFLRETRKASETRVMSCECEFLFGDLIPPVSRGCKEYVARSLRTASDVVVTRSPPRRMELLVSNRVS